MTGRKSEMEVLQALLDSPRAEFLAVTGRRRVGKTFLVDSFYGAHFCFSMTGIQNQGSREQLVNFAVRMAQYDGTGEAEVPQNWQWAFVKLRQYLDGLDGTQKGVLFLDELPWIAASDRSFVQMLAHFWNDYLSKQTRFILVICGSATSWVTQKILNDPGGMHNRVTRHLHVRPFTLKETQAYLFAQRIDLTATDLARVYMALGGIPYYLNGLRRGDSFVTAVDRLCFTTTGLLRREYNNLFAALFSNAATHETIVRVLANHPRGLSRTRLTEETGIRSQSMLSKAIEELTSSDFLVYELSHGARKRGARYRLVDEFCLFYHKFMIESDPRTPVEWTRLSQSQGYRSWAGVAFELLCWKHVSAINKVLGISGVQTWAGPLEIAPKDEETGVQVDLLIDRRDDSVNLCEMKFYAEPFALTKVVADELLRKRRRVRGYFKGRKQVLITLVTNGPPEDNKWFREVVDQSITLEELIDAL